MNPNKNFKPSHDEYDRDRGAPNTGLNQVNPNNTENQTGTPKKHQGGDPSEVGPQQRQPNRDTNSDKP